jgi:phenylpropionate dioxygenase-like ring-hydroxylating dioxygenase large terminal subunit
MSLWLKDLWYLAAPGRALKPGAVSGHVIMDQPVLIGRAKDGAPFAFRDLCPHRGVHLSDGRYDGEAVACAFHGWRFAPDGACVGIPSLVSGQEVELEKIRLRTFPVREVQGNLWIYIGDSSAAPQTAPFVIPDIGERPYNVATPLIFETDMDNAVFGLLDPAHGAFVHQQSWWRSPGNLQDKEKAFEPEGLGFTMVRHKPSSNSAIYKILGGDRTAEISFRLPGVRLEHIRTGAHHICNLTAITPISATRCQVVNCLYWTQGWLSALKPMAAMMAKRFLTQDQQIVGLQNKTRRYNPPTMLIRDADAQQRWYLQLKRAWSQSRETGAPFENPIEPQTLRWRT